MLLTNCLPFQCVCRILSATLTGALFILQHSAWVAPPLGNLPFSVLGRVNSFLYNQPLNSKGLNCAGSLTQIFFLIVNTRVLCDPWSGESADAEPQMRRHPVYGALCVKRVDYTFYLDFTLCGGLVLLTLHCSRVNCTLWSCFIFQTPYVVVSKFSSVTCRSLLDSKVRRQYSVHGWTGHILWPLGQAQGLACRGSTFLAWDSGFGINAIVACLCWGISLPSHPSCSFVMAARPSVAASQGPAFFQCFLPLPSHYNMCPTLASPTELWVP